MPTNPLPAAGAARGETPQQEPGNPPRRDPARFLRHVLYSFLGVVVAGAILTSLPSPPPSTSRVDKTTKGESANSESANSTHPTAPESTPGTQSPTNPTPSPTDTIKGTVTPNTIQLSYGGWLSLLLFILLLAVCLPLGYWMMLDKNSPTARKVGGLALAGTSLAGATGLARTFLHDLKFDTSFKFDKPTLNVNWGPHKDGDLLPNAAFSVNAESIGSVWPFPKGRAVIKPGDPKADDAKAALDALRLRIEKRSPQDQVALILLVGSADRQPLHGALLHQYESNVGLAQARAEWVRAQLVADSPKIAGQLKFLVLASGPRKTDTQTTPADLERDRSVEAWILYGASIQTPSQSTKKLTE